MVLKYANVRSIAEHRPIGTLKRHILVIVQKQRSCTSSLASIPAVIDSDLRVPRRRLGLPNHQFTYQGLTLALAPRSIAKRRSADGNLFLHGINKAFGIFGFFEFFFKD